MKEIERRIYDYLASHEEDIIADIERLCAAESPSNSKPDADKCARVLKDIYKERIGAESEIIPVEEVGDNLVTELGEGDRRLLIVGHYDTVHPVGAVKFRREGRILYGPGVTDMKGGDISVIWAIRALQELGIPLGKRITIVNNSDEETGSLNSRPLMLEKAKGAFACIVAEPAAKGGLIKLSRKGGGGAFIKCYGKAAHAGLNPKDGVNANVELAHQMIYIQSQSDYDGVGTTFCPNIIKGGTASNVVCDYAEVEVDWRVCILSEVERVKKIFAEMKAVTEGARVECTVRVGHPPMELTDAGRALFATLEDCAADLDMEIKAAPMVGGCSDGNDISAAGVPTIDGMGTVGDGAHCLDEHIYLDHLVPRIALMSSFIARL